VRATVQHGYALAIARSRRQLTGLLIVALACVAPAAAAPSAMAHEAPPAAQTIAPTAVGTDSATLAGAVDPNGSDTWYFFVYGVDRYSAHTPLARAGAGADPVAVSAQIGGLSPGTTYHVRLIAFSHHGFGRGDDVPFTTAAPALPAPAPPAVPSSPATAGSGAAVAPPVLGQSVNVTVRSGKVTVKVPGAAGYVALGDLTSLPVGSILDTREGSVTLRSALPGGQTQSAIFHGGLFEVRQPAGAAGLTELVLRGALTGCSSARARAAAASKRKRKPPRRLWGSDSRGKFRTRGGNSVATVRGTSWYVEDRCDGTLTRVSKGSVRVYDRGRKRTVIVRAGHSYLARSIR
jgi:hypothetical protein